MDADEQEQFDRKSRSTGKDGGSTPNPDPTELTTDALLREISALRTLIDQRINATEALFDTKIMLGREGGMALKELFDTKIVDLTVVLNERYATQTKALDAAFLAQQAAVATSFDASEKAVAAALLAAKEAVQTANLANEKRFDSISVTVGQLNDTISRLLPRNEADVRFAALDARATDNKDNIAKLAQSDVGSLARLAGSKDQRSEARANYAGYYALAGVALTLVIVIVMIMNVVTTKTP